MRYLASDSTSDWSLPVILHSTPTTSPFSLKIWIHRWSWSASFLGDSSVSKTENAPEKRKTENATGSDQGVSRNGPWEAGKGAPRVGTKIAPVAKTSMGTRQHHDIIKKDFTNFDRLDIKINLVPSVFLLFTCQIALIKRKFKTRKSKFILALRKSKN